MINILVVDDEKWIREGIIAKVKNCGHKISNVYGAADGEKALEMIAQYQPELVITDIRMPNMDGLQFMKRAAEACSRIKFIVISGYADFDYAKQAINLGASAYLLKPVQDNELMGALSKVIDSLYNENKIIDEIETLRSDNNFLVLEKLLNEILHSANNHEESIKKLKSYMDVDGKCFVLGLVHIDQSNYKDSNFNAEDVAVIKYAITNVLLELSNSPSFSGEDVCTFYNFKNADQIFVLMSAYNEEHLQQHFLKLMACVREKIREHLNITITIAVSNSASSLSSTLYQQASSAFHFRSSGDHEDIYTYANHAQTRLPEVYSAQLRQLELYLRNYDYQNLELALNEIFSVDAADIKHLYFLTVNTIIKTYTSMNVDTSLIMDILADDILDSFHEPSQIADYILNIVRELMKSPRESSIDCKKIIKEAIDYIDKNYFKELSVKSLSNTFGINPNYFSTLFKNETNKPFTRYLTDMRIEKACAMLKNTNLNIIEVANHVGYQDSQYFYRVFKKITGKTPLEYRLEE